MRNAANYPNQRIPRIPEPRIGNSLSPPKKCYENCTKCTMCDIEPKLVTIVTVLTGKILKSD